MGTERLDYLSFDADYKHHQDLLKIFLDKTSLGPGCVIGFEGKTWDEPGQMHVEFYGHRSGKTSINLNGFPALELSTNYEFEAQNDGYDQVSVDSGILSLLSDNPLARKIFEEMKKLQE